MGQVTPVGLRGEAEDIEAATKKLLEAAKKNLADFAGPSTSFETLHAALHEGADEIKSLQRNVDAAIATFDKISAKLDGIRAQMVTVGKAIRVTQTAAKEQLFAADRVRKAAEKLAAINQNQQKDFCVRAKTTCDALYAKLTTLTEKLEIAAGTCETLPKVAQRPK